MVVLARNWWVVALRGMAGVLFGLATFVWPTISLAVLVLLFGAYALVDGVLALVASIRAAQRHERWWALLLEGITGIAAGVMTFFWPEITALTLLYLIAAWALITGLLEIATAIRLRREIQGEWLLAVSGAASILFGLILAALPAAGALAVIWIIGAYAMIFGILLVALSLRLRGLEHGPSGQDRPPAHAGA